MIKENKMVNKKFNEQETEDRNEAKRDMKMWLANDWELKEETPEMFILTKNKQTGWGHFWVFLFTFWFTFGIGNLIYYFVSKKTKKIIK